VSTIVALIGPIEWWWDTSERPNRFNAPDAQAYRAWRDEVDVELQAAGCLVYRPHKGFRGPWDERAQVFNDAMIQIADFVVCIRPPGVPGKGTDHELALARELGKPVYFLPPGSKQVRAVAEALGKVV